MKPMILTRTREGVPNIRSKFIDKQCSTPVLTPEFLQRPRKIKTDRQTGQSPQRSSRAVSGLRSA